jgi:hypothetical protein
VWKGRNNGGRARPVRLSVAVGRGRRRRGRNRNSRVQCSLFVYTTTTRKALIFLVVKACCTLWILINPSVHHSIPSSRGAPVRC